VTAPRIDRRRFLGGSALLGLSAALGPAGIATLRHVAVPGAADVSHSGQVPHAHAPRPILAAPEYVTVVLTRRTTAGVPYREAVARRVPGSP
jgi:hypothetical protein